MALSADVVRIRKLVWAYFFLLIFEGALRKWVLPSLATPLLVVRDPIVLAAYALALRARIFPRNYFMIFAVPLAAACLAVGLFAPATTPTVVLYGFRADFLHLPLIFLIPKVFTERDVKEVGRWTLWLALPLALLMVVQFRSSPDSWINSGADQSFKQLESAMGRIRAPATFSFISGPVYYFALVSAFIFWSQFSRRQYPVWHVAAASAALLSASVVSGSRALIAAAGVVFICASLAAAVLQPWLIFRWLWSLCLAGVLVYGLSNLSFFQEGLQVLDARVQGASAVEGGAEGFATRYFSGIISALPLFWDAPLWGLGLGMGTNAGAALLTGEAGFLLAEGEWPRVLLESGPLLGGAFLAWRLCLAASLGWHSARHAARGNPLPLLLFGACGLLLINGQFGQNTDLGFAVLSSGLCLAAMRPGAKATAPTATASETVPDTEPEGAPGEAPGEAPALPERASPGAAIPARSHF